MKPKRVVLIDDEYLMRTTTSMLLERHGFEIVTAANGGEGITAVLEHPPDIVLLDIMMPGMDGWEVLRRLKADERTRKIRIIIFTACELPVPQDIADQYGTFEFLRKPFPIQLLLEIVNKKEPRNG